MSKKIVVFGTGGFGREIMEALYEQNLQTKEYEILGFIDDNADIQRKEINFFKVIGNTEFLLDYSEEINVLICLGEPSIRQNVYNKLKENKKIQFPNFILDDVKYNKRTTKLGIGNIIYYGCILSTNIQIGNFNYINLTSTLSHDVKLLDFVTISPGCNISGNVTLEDGVYIGTKTAIRDEITIGSNTIIGMGSVVIKDIERDVVAIGCPCKVKSKRNSNERIFK